MKLAVLTDGGLFLTTGELQRLKVNCRNCAERKWAAQTQGQMFCLKMGCSDGGLSCRMVSVVPKQVYVSKQMLTHCHRIGYN